LSSKKLSNRTLHRPTTSVSQPDFGAIRFTSAGLDRIEKER